MLHSDFFPIHVKYLSVESKCFFFISEAPCMSMLVLVDRTTVIKDGSFSAIPRRISRKMAEV